MKGFEKPTRRLNKMRKKIIVYLLMFCFILLKCQGLNVERDDLGMSHIYIVNNSSNKIGIKTYKSIKDSLIELSAEIDDTVFICSDVSIGGWLPPVNIIERTEITAFDKNGNAIGWLVNNCDNDSFWVNTPNSTWEDSFWYYSVE